MDSAAFRWFNRLADRTHWAHGLMRWYANNGIVLFALGLKTTLHAGSVPVILMDNSHGGAINLVLQNRLGPKIVSQPEPESPLGSC